MKRMLHVALIGASALALTLCAAGCARASVATSQAPGFPSAAPATAATSTDPLVLWGNSNHSSFTVTVWGGEAPDCNPVASGVFTESAHKLTVTFTDHVGAYACAAVATATTYTFDTPEAIDATRPVTVIVSYGRTRNTLHVP